MSDVNAISKVRFSSAKAQRIQLLKSKAVKSELLCMESRQQITGKPGEWLYYVISGKGELSSENYISELSAGQLAAMEAGQDHTLTNSGEGRLICLAVGIMAGR